MRRFAPILFALLLLLSACAAPGTRENYVQVNDAYIAAVENLTQARVQGVFTAEEWEEDILPLINEGDALLDEYDALTEYGFDAPHVVEDLKQVLQRLRPYIVKTE